MKTENVMTGSDAMIHSLIKEDVNVVFGYPGGQILKMYDRLYDYHEEINHVLVRHEQGAVHAAQGYARVSGKVGVVVVTSGPGATNVVTGIADAMIDSTPIVVITGQVAVNALGSDAFQEVDVIGMTQPVSKWSYQIRTPEEIPSVMARAFYIANNGRPGPVVIDFTKDAQIGMTSFSYKKCNYIRSFFPYPDLQDDQVAQAAALINGAQKPLIVFGQGVILAEAEKELMAFAEKSDIPMASTILGLSAVPSDHPLFWGIIGMHGNVAPNMKTNECDVLIAIGMRFDDRVTGNLKTYAKQAKIIHLDIDAAEINKNVPVDVAVIANCKESLPAITNQLIKNERTKWNKSFEHYQKMEEEKVIKKEVYPENGFLKMGEVINKVSEATGHKAILVTDVGQNQMMGVRYFKYSQTRSVVTSGGLGTMGFGLPAAIGAKYGAPERTVCAFLGDGGLQMTIQELGTILQKNIAVKIILLNNNFLGMVRQWQELFFQERYSETIMKNPDFCQIAQAYGIQSKKVEKREQLDDAIKEMLDCPDSFLLNVCVEENGMVYPMVPTGACITNIIME